MSDSRERRVRQLIGMQALLIAAGAEMSRLNGAEFTPLGQQAGAWRADATRIIGEIEQHIEALSELASGLGT